MNIQHKGYKPNLSIDMVGAALAHYKKFNRPVDVIELHPTKWEEFKKGILERKPEWEADINHFNEVMFKNCKVKKGSEFIINSMVVYHRELIIDESYKAKKAKELKEMN